MPIMHRDLGCDLSRVQRYLQRVCIERGRRSFVFISLAAVAADTDPERAELQASPRDIAPVPMVP
jgi:hypothetical protein